MVMVAALILSRHLFLRNLNSEKSRLKRGVRDCKLFQVWKTFFWISFFQEKGFLQFVTITEEYRHLTLSFSTQFNSAIAFQMFE